MDRARRQPITCSATSLLRFDVRREDRPMVSACTVLKSRDDRASTCTGMPTRNVTSSLRER